ncbi:hypothetical protein, conserved [Eimeria brunetti]|uniref:Uncharacterized protein n=1 Tax=Eimeria brunetti TaxID=51314 RepID=U6LPQ8_9EIME|nr:hypothetical protein, conserved [Eimeria brunetti]
MLSHRKAEEVNSAQPVESSASEQTETAHSEENTVADRLGALGEGLHQRKRKQGTSAGMADEGDASREKNPLLDTNVDGRRARSGRQLGSHAGPPSEEDQINLWLSSTAEDPSVEKPFAEGLHTPLASSMSLSSADNGEPAGGVKSRAAHAITLIHSPYDFNLESLLEEGDNIEWGTWFPEPITDTRPVSHFTANVDLSDCEEFKTYQKAEDEPTAPSAGAGPWESPPQDSGLTEMGAGPSSAMNQSEAKPPMKGEESAVRAAPETNIHTNMDIEAHPFVRFPSVPVGISERQFDMSKAQVFAGIRRNPVFSLSICRQIFLKSSLDKTDFHILLATVERLAFYALKTMDVSLCLYSRRSLGKVGTVFLVVDALYCAIQVLGENAKSKAKVMWMLLVQVLLNCACWDGCIVYVP